MSQAPIIYNAHPVTREFIGTGVADPDPLEPDNWLIPAYAYADAPPDIPSGHVAQRSMDGDSWQLVADYRGLLYSTETGEPQQHDALGELPASLTTEPRPSPDHRWDGSGWVFDAELHAEHLHIEAQALRQQIDVERDRRIDAGVEFQGVMFQSRATDRENIAGAAQLAFMAVVAGAQAGDLRWSNPDQDFAWIASDNSLVPMDAQTVVAFGKAAAERKQALIFSARQLKDMAEIPLDYTDDKWWP